MSEFDPAKHVEGVRRQQNLLKLAVEYENLKNINLPPIFHRYIVLDVINDQKRVLDQDLLNIIQQKYGEIENLVHAKDLVLPRNSIIAKRVYNSSMSNRFEAQKSVVLYPFFPSHIALPCKPGEHVWVMFESITEIKSLGYWFCRIVGPDHVDDVNHSHAPREYDSTFFAVGEPTESAIREATGQTAQEPSKPRFHFKNGLFVNIDVPDKETKEPLVNPKTSTLLLTREGSESVDPDAYENVISGSSVADLMVREPVPRYKKNPADLTLEGSNNSLITLGVDRNLPGPDAGSIDMVVGRGSRPETMGNIAENVIGTLDAPTAVKGSELDKFYQNLVPTEGNPDYTNDRSRILITQRTKVDAGFGISSYNSRFDRFNAGFDNPFVQDTDTGDAAIVIKTDKVRIIARSDIQLLVKGAKPDTSPTGAIIKTENATDSAKKWASITIKSNGDIVFIPSEEGYIKLGGDDADKGIVCSAVPVAKVAGGIVGDAIQNTAGGRLGGSSSATASNNTPAISPKHGTFANKVLVK